MQANTKEWIQYGTASLMIVSGVVLTFISFFLKGDVTDGVLWYMAQALTYAGAIFGVSVYFKQKTGEVRNELRNYFDKKLDEEKNYELKNGGRVTEEQVEAARQLLAEFEQIKNQQKHEDTH